MSAKSLRVGVDGLGYMGLATALAFAARGHTVVGFDVSPRVRSEVRAGRSPYEEKGLSALLRAQLKSGRFQVVDSVAEMVAASDGIFVCVPTPSASDGRIDLRAVESASRELGGSLRGSRTFHVVVLKSTVVPGTTASRVEPILRDESGLGPELLGVASNPEFLSEGTMVEDALRPPRVVLGTSDARSSRWLTSLYRPFHTRVEMNSTSGAELVKYASNAFLAMKVSFVNEVARFSEAIGVDVDDVARAVGADPRIGALFLRAGPGFGGSCFTKDLRALRAQAAELGLPLRLWDATLAANADRTAHVGDLMVRSVGSLAGKRVAVLGLAFKAGTNDARDSQAGPIIEMILDEGASVRAHDPEAVPNFQRVWETLVTRAGSSLTFHDSVAATLEDADVALLHTDWPIYRTWPTEWTRTMRTPVIVDTRRILDRRRLERGGARVVALGVGGRGTRT